ncbi:hypothetical protein [Methylophilus sp. TWE2]|uniref:hypothetical protein n=1 Tax=Methylophilus sp. TWE2 TaxID=1662285 RepID=UPI0006714EF0|nr:hypothetical protein [Methylophilus sp. TWE2]AKR42877.1 hypothetical protein ACJ67_05165 [Methylophilus sp. TWE2]
MVALKLLLATALLGSLIWTLTDPGYKPITAVVIAAGCLLAIRVNERAQKDKRTYKPEND